MPQNQEIEENLVVKSNELIVASYAMSVNEQRLLLACISQIDSRQTLRKGAEFVLTVEEARDLFYTKGDQWRAYRDLRDASERLFERKVRIDLGDEKELLTRFVQSVKFDHKEMQVVIEFADKIIPYLSQLEQNFTKYRLRNIVQLTSSHAIRLYELIVSWAGQGQSYKEMEIEELKGFLSIENKYRQFSELNRYVILPSIKQINEETDFELDIVFKKKGRAYKWVQLRFNRKAEAEQAEAEAKAARLERKEHNAKAKAKREKREAEEAVAAFRKQTEEEMNNYFSRYPDGAIFAEKNGRKWEKAGSLLFTNREDGGTVAMQLKAAFAMINDYALFPLEFDIDSPEQQERERLEAEGQRRLFNPERQVEAGILKE